jgi:hypothetical protein
MSRRSHRRPALLRRLCVLAMLALGLALQPTMAAIGELHELAHDASGLHHALAGATAAADRVDAGNPADPGGLHALLEYAHCCGGQTPLSSGPVAAAALPSPPSAAAPRAESQLPLHARAFVPFRPPIAA